jgi:hypothetical protein
MDKKTYRKNLIISVVMLVLSCAVLVTVVFGWFVVTKTPNVDTFRVQVIKRNDTIKLDMGGHEVGFELILEEVIPGDSYEFFLENTGEQVTSYSVYFIDLSDNIEEVHPDLEDLIDMLGVASLDMLGIFSVRVDDEEDFIFLRQLEVENGQLVAARSIELQPLEKKKIFDLKFENRYLDSDTGETIWYDVDVINAFQGIEFGMKILVTEDN